MTMRKSATDPLEVNHLWPLMTHSSPSRTAVVRIRVGSAPAPGSVMEKALRSLPSSSGSSHWVRCSSRPLASMPMASSSALPESGALLPKTTGAMAAAPEDLVQQSQAHLAEAHAPELGGQVGGPQALAFTSSWSGRMTPRQVVVVEVEGLEGQDLLVHEGARPDQLGLVLGLGLEVPRHVTASCWIGASCRRVRGAGRYRVPVPADATVAPTHSTVSLRAPVEPCPVTLPAPPTPAEARARIAAAAMALLDERRLLDADELAGLAVVPDESVTGLASVAHEVRLAWCGPAVEVEGILSAKTGGCPEDCHFCSQSSRFDTPVKATPFLDTDEVLAAAAETAALGATEFCIVLAVRGPDERTMARLLELVPLVRDRTGLNVAVSAGILTDDQARRLAAGGRAPLQPQRRDGPVLLPEVVTTHGWEERAATCRLVRAHGMELCCGALVGMGESDAQRVELLLQLRDLDPTEVPVNFLNPRPGHAARRPARGRRLGGHPLDRAVPAGPARV